MIRTWAKWAAVVLAFAMVGVSLAVVAGNQSSNTETLAAEQNRRAGLEADLADQQATSQLLAEQIRALGEHPVVSPGAPLPGVAGIPGTIGPQGFPGQRGEAGPAGSRGRRGFTGIDGAAVTGAPGDTGATGSAGANGADGQPGPQGPAGERGNDGAQGDPGPACPDGYHSEQRTVTSTEQPAGEQTMLCVANPA